MEKRLLTIDYDKFVIETISLPESDFENYYWNVINENKKSNIDIIENLISAINRQYNSYFVEASKILRLRPDIKDENSINITITRDYCRYQINGYFFINQLQAIDIIKLKLEKDKLLNDFAESLDDEMLSLKINELKKKTPEKPTGIKESETKFKNLFKSEKDRLFTLKAIEDLKIKEFAIKDEKSKGRGYFIGFIDALKEKQIIINLFDTQLHKAFFKEFGVEYKRQRTDNSYIFDDGKKETISYINKYYREFQTENN